jgi:hypothetical protein
MPAKSSPTRELIKSVEDAGGHLRIQFEEPEDVTRFRHLLWAAARFNLIPAGQILLHRQWTWADHELQLVDKQNADDIARAEREEVEAARQRLTQLGRSMLLNRTRLDELSSRIDAWATHERTVAYLSAMEGLAGSLTAGQRREADLWLEWVRRRIDTERESLFEHFLSMPAFDVSDAAARIAARTAYTQPRPSRWEPVQ